MDTKFCNKCKCDKPVSAFRKGSRFKDGLQTQCILCMDEASRLWRIKNRKRHADAKKRRISENTARLREWKQERGCCICGESEPVCLDFHHLDPNTKEDNLSNLIQVSWDKASKEIEKCVILCKNCHAKVHANIIEIGM